MTSQWQVYDAKMTSNVKKCWNNLSFLFFFLKEVFWRSFNTLYITPWYNNFKFIRVWFKLDFLTGGLGLVDVSQRSGNILSWNVAECGKRKTYSKPKGT